MYCMVAIYMVSVDAMSTEWMPYHMWGKKLASLTHFFTGVSLGVGNHLWAEYAFCVVPLGPILIRGLCIACMPSS